MLFEKYNYVFHVLKTENATNYIFKRLKQTDLVASL